MTASTAIVPARPTPASLPTYQTVAALLEHQNGSGVRLALWTVARTMLIAPPMMAVGVSPKKAFAGAGLASGLISIFTILRIYNAQFMEKQSERQRVLEAKLADEPEASPAAAPAAARSTRAGCLRRLGDG